MKKFLSKLLAFGIILTLIGGIVFVIGFAISGFNFSKLSSATLVDNSYTESPDSPIDSIELYLCTSDVNVIFDETATEISVAYQTLESNNGKTLTSITASVEAGKLTLRETRDRKYHIFPSLPTAKATLKVPSSREIALSVDITTGDTTLTGNATLKSLNLHSTTGDIDTRSAALKSLSAMSFKVTTGEIRLGKFDTSTLFVKSTTGDVSILDGTVSGNSEIKTTSGDITLLAALTSDKTDIKASSGDVTVKGKLIANALTIKTTSGEIETDDGVIDAESITIDASTADIEIDLLGKREDYTITVQQTTGEANITNQAGGSKTLKIDVTTGDIEVDFK